MFKYRFADDRRIKRAQKWAGQLHYSDQRFNMQAVLLSHVA